MRPEPHRAQPSGSRGPSAHHGHEIVALPEKDRHLLGKLQAQHQGSPSAKARSSGCHWM